MTLRVGIDFDNTIACYDAAFAECAKTMRYIPTDGGIAKQEIKNAILAQPDGETKWQRVQGQVYGRFITFATLFPGISDFLIRCHRHSVNVFIVSHKTDFGHFDEEKINLRDAARGWLKNNGFFSTSKFNLAEDHLFFEYTRAEKINRISKLNLDYFIDDLPEVLLDDEFPQKTRKILFAPSTHAAGDMDERVQLASDWKQISTIIFNQVI